MKRALGTAVLAAAAVALSAPPADAGKKDDTLNILWEREEPNISFYFNNSREGIVIGRMTWDSPLYKDPVTGKIVCNLCTKFTIVDDTTFEFELRQDVKFHNGDPMTADDWVFTYNYISNPDSKLIQQETVDWVKAAEKLGPYKVRITAKAPNPVAVLYMAGGNPIYPKAYYEKCGADCFPLKPVGTGPYKVVEVQQGKKIVWEKYDGYHKGSPKGQPTIGKVVQRTVQETNVQIVELLSGKADWIWRVPADQAEKLQGRAGVKAINAATMRIGYVTMDAAGKTGKDNPFTKLKVRQAVAHAINREGIVKNLVRGASKVIHAACFPTQFGCTEPNAKYDYSPEKAKKLLAEAGYPNGFTTTFHGYRERPYAEAMAADLAAVGIKTELRFGQYTATREAIRGGQVALAFMTWGSGSVPDVDAILPVFFNHGPDDMSLDADVKTWLDKGGSTVMEDVRKDVYTKAVNKIADQVYWVPLWTYNTWYAVSADHDFIAFEDEIPRFFMSKWK